MFSSAELIEALQRRARRSIRPPPPPGEWPAGWRDWFAAMAARPGRVTGPPAADVVAAAGARMPPLPAGIAPDLGRWRAFTTLWRQGPQPASRDERWMRIASMSASLLLHVLMTTALVWLMLHRFHFLPASEDAREGEEHVLQVEYIGEGSPLDAGGGAPEGPADMPPANVAQPASQPSSAAPSRPRAESGPPPAPAPDTAEDRPLAAEPPLALPDPEPLADIPVPPTREPVIEVPALAQPAVAAPDVLQVTEVDVPDSRFTVPPPRDAEVAAPRLADIPVRLPDRQVELHDPSTAASPPAPRPLDVDVAPVRVPEPGVAARAREIELAEAREIRLRSAAGVPAINMQTTPRAAGAPSVPERAVPMPSSRPDTGTAEGATSAATGPATREAAGADAATADAGRAASTTDAPPGGRPDAGTGERSTTAAPGAGLLPALPGAPPSGRLSDDWGDSTRNAPGGQAGRPGGTGLFNADGSPRLADGGAVGGGLPPGTITEDFENVDRHGTWLKRPPYDYEPTSFDRFWLPGETLLEEWVRRSVTEVRIPIPGTTKSIRCMTVLLAAGGACDIVDPNLQEQAAGARPPPDVPFKPELQEARDSLRRPAGD